MIETVKKFSRFTWHHISNLTPEDTKTLVADHDLTHEMIGYAVDHNEAVRMEYDAAAEEALMVIDVISYHDDVVETRPLGSYLPMVIYIPFRTR